MTDYRHIWRRLCETRVLQNYSYMSLLQIINALIGVLIYPYLIRVMGAEAMGIYAFLFGIMMLFQAVEEFGFDMPAVKGISLARNTDEYNRIIQVVYLCKLITLSASVVLAIPIVLLVPVLRENALLFGVIFIQIVYTALFPQWYYQGRKNMRTVTIIQFCIRMSQIPLFFLLVRSADDLIWYAGIVSGTTMVGGIVGWMHLFREGRRWVHVTWTEIKQMFADACPFFVTSITGIVKDKTLVIVIGAFVGMREVAIYDLANKIIQMPRLLINSINTALFPEVVGKATRERVCSILQYERWIGLAMMAVILVLGYPAVWVLGGKEMLDAFPVAVILSYTIYAYLVVGAYLQFCFVATNNYRLVATNQLIAMASCLILCMAGMWIHPSAWIVALALSLSGGIEILYCKYKSKKIEQ